MHIQADLSTHIRDNGACIAEQDTHLGSKIMGAAVTVGLFWPGVIAGGAVVRTWSFHTDLAMPAAHCWSL